MQQFQEQAGVRAGAEAGTRPWSSNQLHCQGCSPLVTPTEMLQRGVQGKAVQPNCSQHPACLHCIALPLTLIHWPPKSKLLRNQQQPSMVRKIARCMQPVVKRAAAVPDDQLPCAGVPQQLTLHSSNVAACALTALFVAVLQSP